MAGSGVVSCRVSFWSVLTPQCISTIAVTRRETNGGEWPAFMVGYLFDSPYNDAGAAYWAVPLVIRSKDTGDG